MSIIGSNILAGASSAVSTYEIENSLRFVGDNGPSLVRDITSVVTSSNFTFSCWFKGTDDNSGPDASTQDCYRLLYSSGNTDVNTQIGLASKSGVTDTDDLCVRFGDIERPSGEMYMKGIADQLTRDFAAWYHLCLSYDQSLSAEDRVKVFINGVQLTWSAETNPTGNRRWVFDKIYVGRGVGNASGNDERPWDGYMAEVHILDGITKVASDFGETSAITNQWIPIEYTGSYGTDGAYLKFEDSADFGNDSSGNGNDFTATNLAATEQMPDSPTNNFCTMNSNDLSWSYATGQPVGPPTLSQGNLQVAMPDSLGYRLARATQAVASGKWYFEMLLENTGVSPYNHQSFGIATPATNAIRYWSGAYDNVWQYQNDGWTRHGEGSTGPYSTYTTGDIMSCAFDCDGGKIWWGKNGTWENSGDPAAGTNAMYDDLVTIIARDGSVTPFSGMYENNAVEIFNFGQDSSFAGNETAQGNKDSNDKGDFYYTPPTDFLTLCTDNLSDPEIALPGEHFNTVVYTGNGSTQTISSLDFQPDFVWIKDVSGANSWGLFNSIMGAGVSLKSNDNSSERPVSGSPGATDDMYAFTSSGFSVGTNNYINVNTDTSSYVSWSWKAGTTFDPATAGSVVTGSGSANSTAGFSVIEYEGTGANMTIGHGLSQAPELIIVKNRDQTDSWMVYCAFNTSEPATEFLVLDSSAATSDNAGQWNDALPSSSVFTVGDDGRVNANTENYIAYCFHAVEGYSRLGTYFGGNGNDGPFISLGFRPAYILFKCTSNAGGSGGDQDSRWMQYDNKHYSYNGYLGNVNTNNLWVNESSTQATSGGHRIDLLSNGFKQRSPGMSQNHPDESYIYYCVAAYPFKYANAR